MQTQTQTGLSPLSLFPLSASSLPRKEVISSDLGREASRKRLKGKLSHIVEAELRSLILGVASWKSRMTILGGQQSVPGGLPCGVSPTLEQVWTRQMLGSFLVMGVS